MASGASDAAIHRVQKQEPADQGRDAVRSVALRARSQQAAFDPALDMDGGEPAVRTEQVVEVGHVNCSIALRGS